MVLPCGLAQWGGPGSLEYPRRVPADGKAAPESTRGARWGPAPASHTGDTHITRLRANYPGPGPIRPCAAQVGDTAWPRPTRVRSEGRPRGRKRPVLWKAHTGEAHCELAGSVPGAGRWRSAVCTRVPRPHLGPLLSSRVPGTGLFPTGSLGSHSLRLPSWGQARSPPSAWAPSTGILEWGKLGPLDVPVPLCFPRPWLSPSWRRGPCLCFSNCRQVPSPARALLPQSHGPHPDS